MAAAHEFAVEDDAAAVVRVAQQDGVAEREAKELNLNLEDRRLKLTLELAKQLIGTPRHLSQHPGGFVLTLHRLDEMVPVEPAAMENRQVVEWDKDDIDALGLMKIDVLALGTLVGLALGIGIAVLRTTLDNRVRTPRDASTRSIAVAFETGTTRSAAPCRIRVGGRRFARSSPSGMKPKKSTTAATRCPTKRTTSSRITVSSIRS